MGRQSKFKPEFYELYYQGLTDAKIAQRLGVSENTVRYWRRKRGLLALNKRALIPIPSQLPELFRQGRNGEEIAKLLGVSDATVYRWRRQLGLLLAKRRGVPMEAVLTLEQCEIVREFLRFCVTYAKQQKDKTGKIDASKLIKAYRDYSLRKRAEAEEEGELWTTGT